MKYLLKIALGIVACAFVMVACNDDDEVAVGFRLDKTETGHQCGRTARA